MSIKSKLESLIASGNQVTGENRDNVTDVMQDLVDGYGQGGTVLQEKSVTFTPANVPIATYVQPDAGYDGLSQVNVTVNAIRTQEKTGHVIPDALQQTLVINKDNNYDGMTKVTVTTEGVTCTNLLPENIVNGVTVKVGVTSDDDAIASVTGTASGGTLPHCVDHITYTMTSDATSSAKQNIQLSVRTKFMLFITCAEYPSPPTSGYTALTGCQVLYGSTGNRNGYILRSDGTVGTDTNMFSYSTSTGVLSIGGQYGTFRTGQIFDIYLFELA